MTKALEKIISDIFATYPADKAETLISALKLKAEKHLVEATPEEIDLYVADLEDAATATPVDEAVTPGIFTAMRAELGDAIRLCEGYEDYIKEDAELETLEEPESETLTEAATLINAKGELDTLDTKKTYSHTDAGPGVYNPPVVSTKYAALDRAILADIQDTLDTPAQPTATPTPVLEYPMLMSLVKAVETNRAAEHPVLGTYPTLVPAIEALVKVLSESTGDGADIQKAYRAFRTAYLTTVPAEVDHE